MDTMYRRSIPGYFNDLIGSLEAHGRTGTSVVFDWPSGVRGSTAFGPFNYVWTLLDSFLADTVSTELEMYDIGRRTAEGRASDALAELVGVVHQRNGGRAIDIVAHSMGCYLLLQALRKHPTLSSRVGRIVMLAPAFQSSALEEPVTLTAIGAVPEVHIYHSRHDAVLRLLGSVRHATSMMGAVGISSRTRVPTSIRFHDVSDVLRSGDVHGAYLKTTGIEATGYWALLRP